MNGWVQVEASTMQTYNLPKDKNMSVHMKASVYIPQRHSISHQTWESLQLSRKYLLINLILEIFHVADQAQKDINHIDFHDWITLVEFQ